MNHETRDVLGHFLIESSVADLAVGQLAKLAGGGAGFGRLALGVVGHALAG